MNAEILTANIGAHWVQAGVVAAVSFLAIRLLDVRAPGYRLVALQLTLLIGLLLPVVQPYDVEEQPQQQAALTTGVAGAEVIPDVAVAQQPGTLLPVHPLQALLFIVVAGVALRLAWLIYGVIRLVRFSRHATEVAPPHAAALETTIGVSPRYILQTGNRGPWTFGPFRPTVALPSRFDALSPEFQRAVICHELLHIKRRDITVALVEELAVAILWFHPWAWLLRARIRVAREQVVDARVVEILGDRDDYVRCLISISGHDLAPHFSQAGAGMLRPRELRARVDAIFQEARMSGRRFVAVTVALMMAVGATTYAVAAALPMRSPAEPRLAIPEPLAATQASGTATPGKLDPATSRPLAIQFKDARLSAVLDFLTFATSVVFTGYEASFDEGRSVTIKAEAPLEELLDRLLTPSGLTYTVTGPRTIAIVKPAPSPQQTAPQAQRKPINMVPPESPQDALERGIRGTVVVDVTASLSVGPDASGAYRVGGAMQPPKKVKDVPPLYPALAREARAQGTVVMEIRIDERGAVSDVQTLRSIPLLDAAAIDAVRQWQYEPTLLNGVAVPMLMTVTVNFSLRDLINLHVVTPDGKSGAVDLHSGRQLELVLAPGVRFQLKASYSRDSNKATVAVFSEDGQSHLGDVVLPAGGPLMQSPTTPSFGLQLLGVR